MVDWKVTANSINCQAVAEEVTIIVNRDWSVKCSGCDKLKTSRQAQLRMIERSMNLRRSLECRGLQCDRITEYIRKLKSEEPLKPVPGGENK